MRKIRGSSSYLKNQVRKNLVKAALSLLIIGGILFTLTLRIVTTQQVGSLEEAGLLISIAPLIGFYFYLRKYRIYSGGWKGEKQVAEQLNSKLNDDYSLLNDLYLGNGGGDIDHIVLGPNGISVLETKNWSGSIFCNGDDWQRGGKRSFSGSPSRQVKRNVAKIKQLIDNNSSLRSLNIWIEGIVVFTNDYAKLHVNNPTVPILTLPQLPNHILGHRNLRTLSREQIETIGKEILKQRN